VFVNQFNFLSGGRLSSKSISFNTPGLVTLPSWLSFSCASTRTAQTSSSTIIRGVGANQAVANIWGLQHEPSATNYCQYSENFAATGWTQNQLTMYSSAISDPAGNSTGCDASVIASGYGGGYYFAGAPITLQPTCSGFIKSSGTSPNQANFGMLNKVIAQATKSGKLQQHLGKDFQLHHQHHIHMDLSLLATKE